MAYYVDLEDPNGRVFDTKFALLSWESKEKDRTLYMSSAGSFYLVYKADIDKHQCYVYKQNAALLFLVLNGHEKDIPAHLIKLAE